MDCLKFYAAFVTIMITTSIHGMHGVASGNLIKLYTRSYNSKKLEDLLFKGLTLRNCMEKVKTQMHNGELIASLKKDGVLAITRVNKNPTGTIKIFYGNRKTALLAKADPESEKIEDIMYTRLQRMFIYHTKFKKK